MKGFRHNLGLKLVSLLFALTLYGYVFLQNSQVVTRTVQYQVKPSGSVPDNIIAPTFDPIKMSVEGPPDELNKIDLRNLKNLSAYVDLTDANPGTGVYRLDANPYRDFPELRDVTWTVWPRTITLNLSQRREKSMSLVKDPQGVPEGWSISQEVEPSTVVVSGPNDLVKSVTTVSVQVDYNEQISMKPRMVQVQCLDSKGKPVVGVKVEPSQVQVTAHFSKSLTSRPLLVIPSFRGQPEFGYRVSGAPTVTPDEVSVSASSQDELKTASTIETETIDINGATHNITKTVRLITSGTLKPKLSSVKVTVHIVPDPNARRTAPPPTIPTPTTTTGGATGGTLSGL